MLSPKRSTARNDFLGYPMSNTNWKDDGLARPVEAARLRTEKELGSIERAVNFRDQIKHSLELKSQGASNLTAQKSGHNR